MVSTCPQAEATIVRKNATKSNTDTHTYSYMCTLRPRPPNLDHRFAFLSVDLTAISGVPYAITVVVDDSTILEQETIHVYL